MHIDKNLCIVFSRYFLKDKYHHCIVLFLCAGVFEGLESLEILSLGDNLIQYIHPEALTSLGNLQQLFLDNNRLVTLETDSLPVPAGSRGAEWSRVMSMTLGLNPLRCDGGLCWLWEAERAGNFRLVNVAAGRAITTVADPGDQGGHAPPPLGLQKIVIIKMATECGGLYFMFLAPLPLSEVSGSATVQT